MYYYKRDVVTYSFYIKSLNLTPIMTRFKACLQCATFEGRAFLSVHRVLSYPILPLPQHIRYYFSKRELGVANTIIVCCSNAEKYDLLFGERLDLRSSIGKTNFIFVYNTIS